MFTSQGASLTVCEYVKEYFVSVLCALMFVSLIMSGSVSISVSVCMCVCVCVCFWWVTTDTAASSGRATLADNSVSVPAASGSANEPSSRWPHPHPAWLRFRAAFTSTRHTSPCATVRGRLSNWKQIINTCSYSLACRRINAYHKAFWVVKRFKPGPAGRILLDNIVPTKLAGKAGWLYLYDFKYTVL